MKIIEAAKLYIWKTIVEIGQAKLVASTEPSIEPEPSNPLAEFPYNVKKGDRVVCNYVGPQEYKPADMRLTVLSVTKEMIRAHGGFTFHKKTLRTKDGRYHLIRTADRE